jgi:transcriptional regulator with XRE-family HTH domain
MSRNTSPSRAAPIVAPPTVGDLLRQWRERRTLSQQRLAEAAAVSTRHLSFLETGRSRPSRSMVIRLSEKLELPRRDRNRLLCAAGFAPEFDLSSTARVWVADRRAPPDGRSTAPRSDSSADESLAAEAGSLLPSAPDT